MDNFKIVQDSISDSNEIFERIKYELSNAQEEILVAMAWFTNQELFDILLQKVSEGVKIDLIISEQVENEKLDFNLLKSKGVDFLKIKNIGWGMMHQKFCVIDRKIAITGSYNWSVNAKNNHENVIVTNFQKTVSELIDTFFMIQQKGKNLFEKNSMEKTENIDLIKQNSVKKNDDLNKKSFSFHEEALNDFKDVLDNVIATEVSAFSKEVLKENAYKRATENNGDHQVLHQAMDSLYSNFINEIEVVDEKKIRLKNKIDEQVKLSFGNVEFRTEKEINSLKENFIIEKENNNDEIEKTEKLINTKKHEISSNNETKIPFIQSKIDAINKKVTELKMDVVKPSRNIPMLILLSIMSLLLISYITVFYTSVAYIFMFSKEETLIALSQGIILESPEVFNPHAITKILNKDIGGILFVFLFVSIPLCLGMLKIIQSKSNEDNIDDTRTVHQNFFTRNIGIILIVIVDIFIAYKVAKNVNDIEYITNMTDHKIPFYEIVFSENFWLVFILGTLGIYLLQIVITQLFSLINRGNLTYQQLKNNHLRKIFEDEITQFEGSINEINELNNDLVSEVSILEVEKDNLYVKLQNRPLILNEKLNDLNQLLLSFKQKIENISQIYKSQVDNDKLPISKTEIENRVNIFMEGWSKYLYEIYSIQKAEAKTSQAIKECENWLGLLSKNYVMSELTENIHSFKN